MGKVILNIDGYIGPFSYSQQWLKEMLSGREKDQVTINMSSLGGRFDHALNMHDQIKTHGNVEVNLVGFNASSATLIAMGAKHRRISENSLFLVHKVMSWIDEFGYMNEDDIDEIIQKLEKEKNENAKMTLVAAKIYHKRTGKPITALLELMKQDTWLNAEEVKDWSFVDEVYDPGQGAQSIFEDYAKVAMIEANGLPLPERKTAKDKKADAQTAQVVFDEKGFVKRIINQLAEYFTLKSSLMKQFEFINKALNAEALEASDHGVYFNQDQLAIIDQLLSEAETNKQKITDLTNEKKQAVKDLAAQKNATEAAKQELTSKTDELQAANSEKDELQGKIDGFEQFTSSLDEIHETVAEAETQQEKVDAIRAILAAKPGVPPTRNLSKSDDKKISANGEDWETIDNLPHNQETE